MVRVYYFLSCSRLRGAYSVLDASLKELARSELEPVQTLVRLLDSRDPMVQYKASELLQDLARHGGSLLPPPKDTLLISAAERCQSEIIKADGLNHLLRLLRGNVTVQGSDRGEVIKFALSSVCNLSFWPANCPLIVEAGFLPLLVPLLEHGRTSDYNREKIIICIRNLSCSGMGSPVSRVL